MKLFVNKRLPSDEWHHLHQENQYWSRKNVYRIARISQSKAKIISD